MSFGVCDRFSKKIAVVGGGFVGTTFAYAAMIKNIASEILIYDLNTKKAEGEVLDLAHGLPFVETGAIKVAYTYEELRGVDVVVVTAGANQLPGETRPDLVKRNSTIMQDIIRQLDEVVPDAVLLIVSNPVDALTTLATRMSKRPKEKIIGSGTVLDTARLHYLMASYCQVSPHSVSGYILGEHGDTEFAAWSTVQVGGNPIALCHVPREVQQDIELQTRNVAYEIIKRKKATYYGIGLALCEIVESIVLHQRMILPVSCVGHPMAGNIALGLPCIVGQQGIEGYVELVLEEDEKILLEKSKKAVELCLAEVL